MVNFYTIPYNITKNNKFFHHIQITIWVHTVHWLIHVFVLHLVYYLKECISIVWWPQRMVSELSSTVETTRFIQLWNFCLFCCKKCVLKHRSFCRISWSHSMQSSVLASCKPNDNRHWNCRHFTNKWGDKTTGTKRDKASACRSKGVSKSLPGQESQMLLISASQWSKKCKDCQEWLHFECTGVEGDLSENIFSCGCRNAIFLSTKSEDILKDEEMLELMKNLENGKVLSNRMFLWTNRGFEPMLKQEYEEHLLLMEESLVLILWLQRRHKMCRYRAECILHSTKDEPSKLRI